MYARVARWEGQTGEELRGIADYINKQSGPPEGVPSTGIMMLMDPDNGRSLMIGLFETEDDLRKGDETLNAMDPPRDDAGERASVELYEVGVDRRL